MRNAAQIGNELAELVRQELDGLPAGDALARRIVANRVLRAIAPHVAAAQPQPPAVPPMSDAEARAFAAERMEFGRHQGHAVENVPLEYLAWLADRTRETWRKLHAYLANRQVRSETPEEEEEPRMSTDPHG